VIRDLETPFASIGATAATSSFLSFPSVVAITSNPSHSHYPLLRRLDDSHEAKTWRSTRKCGTPLRTATWSRALLEALRSLGMFRCRMMFLARLARMGLIIAMFVLIILV
jgi:hypothetical protein